MKQNPPALFLNFFRWYCHPKLMDHIEGDLIEVYRQRLKTKGKRKADIKFIIDVLLLFRPGIIKPTRKYNHINKYAMFKSYFKIGWRNLLKNKGYAAINIGGLAIGMAVAMVIGLWVHDELTFNMYHQNYPRIAQVMKAGVFEGKHYTGQMSLPFPLINELQTNYAANFRHVIPAFGRQDQVLSIKDKKISKLGIYVGKDAPEMLTLKMKYGSWNCLNDPRSLLISVSTAHALFGNVDPRDKDIVLNNDKTMKITGVFEDLPKNSAFYGIQFFGSWDFYLAESPWIKGQGWENHFLQIYAEIQPNTTFEQVDAVIKDAEMKVIKDIPFYKDDLKYKPEVRLLPMSDWHLRSNFYFKKQDFGLDQGPVQFVWFIGAIGVFVLLLACINFMNLSTARSEKRAREVGIRKTIGSVRTQLINQFFSESFLVVAMAFVFAVALVVLSLPWFNNLSSKEMIMPWQNEQFWLLCLVFILVTGMLAGSYPALYLSSFNPVAVLKGTFRVGRFASVPRKVLVVLQFTVSVTLIVCTIVIYNQIMFAKDRPVGYTRDGLLLMPKKWNDTQALTLKNELKNSGVVADVAESAGIITEVWSGNNGFTWKGKDPAFEPSLNTLSVSADFGRTVGWHFTQGRDFSSDLASDSAGFVLNAAAVKYMGLKNPVGEIIHWTNRPWGMDNDFQILGVMDDMIMQSPFDPVEPAVFFIKGWKGWTNIRITPGVSASEALPKIEAVFKKVIPDVPFDYKFADQEFGLKFAAEERIGKLASVFATLAIIISCLGLFGLASFVAEQRTKEIGIRKVMGASVGSLWKMLSGDFVLLVVIACAIALPISFYTLFNWLKKYEYHTELSWWVFAASGFGALLITLATVSFQSVKVALSNPVKSLRSE